ncbi:MAG: cytidine deaminase [bacterium]|nr:cytidine deaminase [bacterium]
MEKEKLMELARQAGKRAYAPYSHFPVGAALLSKSGRVYLGCNVENASYGATNCAERTAVYKAISEGETAFEAIAIAGQNAKTCAPCGICRQVLREFCVPAEFLVYLEDGRGGIWTRHLEELLPLSFGPEQLRDTWED